ncbi:MAG: PP0621 family protein [Gallionellaceae bacterium]|nr:PP0621 family protein [Gallionellaceae bacterium]
MSRLLIFVVIAVIVYFLLKSYRKKLSGEEKRKEDDQVEDMVRCAQCGVHLPKRESIMASEKYYCCDAHRRMHSGKQE